MYLTLQEVFNMNIIIDLFANSPIEPMQKHMEKVQLCVEELTNFMDFALNESWPEAKALQKNICSIENEADELKKTLRLHLPTGLFMPVSRYDLLSLLSAQDKIANKARDIAGLITGRQMQFPEEIKQDLKNYLSRSFDATIQASKAIHQLDELLELGFKGKEVAITEEMVNKLDQIENDVDVLQIQIRHRVFETEKDMPAVNVIFIYKVIEWIGDISDLSQRVGARLELLLAR